MHKLYIVLIILKDQPKRPCRHCCWSWPASRSWMLLCDQPWHLQQCHRNITVQHFSLKGCVSLPFFLWCLIALCFSLSSVSLVLCYFCSGTWVFWLDELSPHKKKKKKRNMTWLLQQAATHSKSVVPVVVKQSLNPETSIWMSRKTKYRLIVEWSKQPKRVEHLSQWLQRFPLAIWNLIWATDRVKVGHPKTAWESHSSFHLGSWNWSKLYTQSSEGRWGREGRGPGNADKNMTMQRARWGDDDFLWNADMIDIYIPYRLQWFHWGEKNQIAAGTFFETMAFPVCTVNADRGIAAIATIPTDDGRSKSESLQTNECPRDTLGSPWPEGSTRVLESEQMV